LLGELGSSPECAGGRSTAGRHFWNGRTKSIRFGYAAFHGSAAYQFDERTADRYNLDVPDRDQWLKIAIHHAGFELDKAAVDRQQHAAIDGKSEYFYHPGNHAERFALR